MADDGLSPTLSRDEYLFIVIAKSRALRGVNSVSYDIWPCYVGYEFQRALGIFRSDVMFAYPSDQRLELYRLLTDTIVQFDGLDDKAGLCIVTRSRILDPLCGSPWQPEFWHDKKLERLSEIFSVKPVHEE